MPAAPTLALQSLTLSHFRSHKMTRLETDGRPIAIYGANGAGKTNILEAISMLSPGRGLRAAKVDELARAPESVGWKISGVLQSLNQIHEIETTFAGSGSRVVRIDDKNTSQAALGRVGRVVWLVPVMDRLWVEGAEGRRRFLDRLALSFHPGHADASLTYEKAMRERNRMLKDQVRDPAWYSAVESQMARAGAQIHANRTEALTLLQAAQDKADTAFPAAHCTLTHADGIALPESDEELAAAFAANRNRDLMAGRTLIGPHRTDLEAVYVAKGIAARSCSTGEQKALLISLVLANSRALAQEFGAPPILLLDEVAAHLDASRRAALFDEICALGAQAWMTGTGPELFTDFGPRAMRLAVREENGLSAVDTH
ncbi:MAG: DNA replication/repair protein RecF [Rhodobacteraceae bacterium]|nr:DNA replication/repair protein RecF [Paracoccaceae bacterium]